MAGEKIVTGTGKVYWAAVGTLPPGIEDDDATLITDLAWATAMYGALGVSLRLPPPAPWMGVGNLDASGFAFAAGNAINFVRVAGRQFAIDARQVAADGGFTMSLLDATPENIVKFGMGDVGAEFHSGVGGGAITLNSLSGPEESIVGISILFDGFGADVHANGDRVRRRYWIPRAVNAAGLTLAINDATPQNIVAQMTLMLTEAVDFTVLSEDHTEPPAAILIDDAHHRKEIGW